MQQFLHLRDPSCCLYNRWMLVGAYVGFATVGVFCAWYMYDSVLGIDLSGDGHTTVTWQQLRAWESCDSWSPAFKACSARFISPASGCPARMQQLHARLPSCKHAGCSMRCC